MLKKVKKLKSKLLINLHHKKGKKVSSNCSTSATTNIFTPLFYWHRTGTESKSCIFYKRQQTNI